ncbi:hypothetical protein EJ110_NYTH57610 [Nymphaea thermarum]|nr:hypothetical protein EJ110_NYTH57610 [Nymphaea thermarum]
MAWIMNSVESRIAPTIAYYTKAKDMWSFLKKTYSHATNALCHNVTVNHENLQLMSLRILPKDSNKFQTLKYPVSCKLDRL